MCTIYKEGIEHRGLILFANLALSPFPSSLLGGLLAFTIQPTLVSLRKSKTAFVALSFHRCLTDGAFGSDRFYTILA